MQDLNSNEYMTFFFYIYIFVFNKVPYKLKRMLCTLKSDIYDFKSLRKENFFEDRLADINETELFIILALYEIKGEVIISVKEYFPAFCTEIENLCKKFKDLKFPGVALHRQLLPGRRVQLQAAGLPFRGHPSGGHQGELNFKKMVQFYRSILIFVKNESQKAFLMFSNYLLALIKELISSLDLFV